MTNRQLTRKIKKMDNNVELKHKDQDILVGQLDADFSVYEVCPVGQGDDERGRIGDEITTTSLKLRMAIRFSPNDFLNTTAMIRMILFWDSAPAGEIPSIVSVTPLDQSVLDPQSSALEPIYDQYDYTTTQNRFRIIYDKVWTLSSQFASVTGDLETSGYPAPVVRFITKKFKLGRKQLFQGGEASYTSWVTNGLFVGWYLYSPGLSTSEFNALGIDANFRLYYKDV